jgi:hypothetical protein
LGIAPCVDRNHHGLCAEAAANGVNQHRIFQRRRVHAHLVGAGLEDLRLHRPQYGCRRRRRRARTSSRAVRRTVSSSVRDLVGRRNVQQHNLVRAFARMARRLRSRIARVHQVDKLHAFDNATAVHIEAGDDALGHHSVPFASHERKLRRIFNPGAPDFSG